MDRSPRGEPVAIDPFSCPGDDLTFEPIDLLPWRADKPR
jgi:hypothetical protein